MSAPLLAPFRGWLVRPEWAGRVIAGAYDSKTPAQRRAIVENNPFSYLGVTRSHEDRIEGCSDSDLLNLSVQTLERIMAAGAFAQSGHPAFFAYRLSSADDGSDRACEQTGIVGALDIEGLRDGRVLTHENVRPERASLIAGNLSHVGATSSPISLTHVAAPELVGILNALAQRTPDVDVVVEGIRNEVWTASEADTARIQPLVEDPVVYVTDGHHRCAAALAGRDARPDMAPFARTLAVLFPHDQLRVEAFHRRVPDRSLRPTAELVEALGTVGTVAALSGNAALRPTARGQVSVYHNGSWFRLVLDPLEHPTTLASLDVERLRRDVIGHVLGVDELDDNSGVDYVPDPSGIAELAKRCDADGCVGLLLYPTDINDLMAVAAAGDLMPPKSSYLNPKPPSGVFLRTLGVGATEHLGPS